MDLPIKLPLILAIGLTLLASPPAFSQQGTADPAAAQIEAKLIQDRTVQLQNGDATHKLAASLATAAPTKLTKFDLDFPGGLPETLWPRSKKLPGAP